MSELREKVRSALPGNVLALMDEIESFASLHIAFAGYQFPPQPNSILKNHYANMVSHDEATIYIEDYNDIDPHAVTHELLHIRRNWVEGVPQLHPVPEKANDNNLRVCGLLDNEVEHLVIVPEASKYGFDPFPFWNAIAKAKWERYPWPDLTSTLDRRNNALLGRLSLALVNDPDVLARAADCLRDGGWTTEADKFAARINKLLGDKARAMGCVVRFLKVPPGVPHLVYFDVRERQRRYAPVPQH